MFAVLQSGGSFPLSIDVWNMLQRVSVSVLANVFRMVLGMPSGPVVLQVTMLLIVFECLVVTFIGVMAVLAL